MALLLDQQGYQISITENVVRAIVKTSGVEG